MKGPSKPPRKGTPPQLADLDITHNTDKPEGGALVPMNFKVSAELKTDIKMFAAMHNMAMVDVIKEGFALLKEKKSSISD